MNKITFLYSIFDARMETYGTPFCTDNDLVAVRQFEHLCNDESTFFNSHPDDFGLYRIGHFDLNNGTLYSADPELLTSAKDYFSSDDYKNYLYRKERNV